MKNIKRVSTNNIEEIQETYDVLIINTHFELNEISIPYKNSNEFDYVKIIQNSIDNILNKNSILFIYGITQELTYYFKYFSEKYTFKYLITSDINRTDEENDLAHRHIDILMMVKGNGLKNLDVKDLRVPYVGCKSCRKNVKDWGGKKHLMNKFGTAISDVWKDFNIVNEVDYDLDVSDIKLNFIDTEISEIELKDSKIPKKLLDRLINMTEKKSDTYLIVDIDNKLRERISISNVNDKLEYENLIDNSIENKVIHSDSIKFLKNVIKKHPNGYFDMIFADPPYNLVKNYSNHNDGMTEDEYIKWCNEWLMLSAKALKPNGSLIVLNIPKWSLHHSLELNKHMYMKNWIVWDSLSIPLGKIMPAHYGLLYYINHPYNYTFNEIKTDYRQNLCLRNKCIKTRDILKMKTKKINDIWSDIYRIKHKKDRDNHPCQLPIGLLDRIIRMTTNEGDIVYDPFGGTGTTAIVAKQLGRRYCISELSKEYVDISNKLLNNVEINGQLVRKSKKVTKNKISKKQIEKDLQSLATELNYKPSKDEFYREYPKYNDEVIK